MSYPTELYGIGATLSSSATDHPMRLDNDEGFPVLDYPPQPEVVMSVMRPLPPNFVMPEMPEHEAPFHVRLNRRQTYANNAHAFLQYGDISKHTLANEPRSNTPEPWLDRMYRAFIIRSGGDFQPMAVTLAHVEALEDGSDIGDWGLDPEAYGWAEAAPGQMASPPSSWDGSLGAEEWEEGEIADDRSYSAWADRPSTGWGGIGDYDERPIWGLPYEEQPDPNGEAPEATGDWGEWSDRQESWGDTWGSYERRLQESNAREEEYVPER